MKILALEFSSSRRSAAAVDAANGAALGAAFAEGDGRGATGLVAPALQSAGWEREEVEALAVSLGPGSYTGIRASIAFAQGWLLGRPVKLAGVSAADALAAQARERGAAGEISVVVDAQRNEFYLARYDLGAAGCRNIEPLRLAPFAEIEAAAKSGRVIGPDAAKWFAGAENLFPDAAMIGKIAAARMEFCESLEPIYLRETAFKKIGG